MPKSPATKQARDWLSTGRAPEDRSLEVALSLALLSGEVPLSPAVFAGRDVKRDVLLALVLEAEARSMFKLVELLRDHAADKEARKIAKKALFRARQRGLLEKPPEPVRVPVKLASAQAAPPSYVSSFDGTGAQVAVWGGVDDRDGPFALLGIISSTKGLESISYMARPSLTRMRTLCDDLRGRFHGEVIEIDANFAGGRLRWGLERASVNESTIDGDTGLCRRLLRDVAVVDAEHVQAWNMKAPDGPPPCRLEHHVCFDDWFTDHIYPVQHGAEDAYLNARSGDSEPDADQAVRAAVAERFNAELRRQLASQVTLTLPVLQVVAPTLLESAVVAANLLANDAIHPFDIELIRNGLGAAVDPDALLERVGESGTVAAAAE